MKNIFSLLAVCTLLAVQAAAADLTLTGLDVLERDGFKQLEGRRVGLITNHSSVNRGGVNAVDAFYKAGNFKLAAIFSPEHGFRGTEEGGVYIASSTDPVTGAPVYSLYGKNKQRPTPEMLADLDVLVFDIQDIGARFYTYLTTMGYAMEEAAKAGLPFLVLDRPNPISGAIEGPVLEAGISAFTAYLQVPTRHGFTAGEMALFHKARLGLKLDLAVIKMENWTRDLFFDQTGIVWTNPSPNIRNLDAEVLYPGLGCLEATNVSVGRGTDIPFLWFGAPWMKAGKIAKGLSRAGLKGVKFSTLRLTPSKDVYEGKPCEGVKIEVTDRPAVRALDIFTQAVYLLKKHNGAEFTLKPEEIRKMTGSGDFYRLLEAGAPPPRIKAEFENSNAAFRAQALNFLLYK
ncbi:MAG: hypothetical protein A2234_00665 [Elusimicrobia bacterium RIFOXYA2_FULL_58_8]|nr:MAG: hypothetical protein A2234_00665 [Elusimicrobia bacterium RIFOXYA2_FULL_58_8]OGS12730.1 MAG: hypothetical protein A2285_07465 [Elusimicrobia bacterium RIFOXYA12_FULL_57_11]